VWLEARELLVKYRREGTLESSGHILPGSVGAVNHRWSQVVAVFTESRQLCYCSLSLPLMSETFYSLIMSSRAERISMVTLP